jgi:alpha-glucosidase (family GH31 glycosyl hydrolase)
MPIEPGELWWGGAIDDGYLMPYSGSYGCDLRHDIKGNQATPLLLSSKGSYIWSDEPFFFHIDDRRGVLEIESDSAPLIKVSGLGDLAGAYRAASRRFFPPSGQWLDPLNFSAPQYNSWIEMQYEPTQRKVLKYAADILAHDLPPGVLMIDDNWFEDHGNWRFDPIRFPDPGAMIKRLHADGFAVMLWVSPFISPDSDTYRALARKKLLVRNADGSNAVREWWNGYSALLDVTHPDGSDWIHEQLGCLVLEFGVDGFKFDAGDPEFIRPNDITHSGVSPLGYCQAWAEIGLSYPRFNEYRACWKLAGQPLGQRLRDKRHVWGRDGLADIIPNGLAQGLAGYSFVCPDMVGGGELGSFIDPEFELDQELLVRTLQCSALFPIVQFSIAPWRVLDEEHWQYCRTAIDIRDRLTPTILKLAGLAARTGEPILRHMNYVYPHRGLERVVDQFMLGDEILVAPVLQKGANTRQVRFPPGAWIGDDEKVIHGPCVQEVCAPLSRLPWFQYSVE